jgi:hypothetical protein
MMSRLEMPSGGTACTDDKTLKSTAANNDFCIMSDGFNGSNSKAIR